MVTDKNASMMTIILTGHVKKGLSADNEELTKYAQLLTTCNYGYEQDLGPLHSEIDSLRPVITSSTS